MKDKAYLIYIIAAIIIIVGAVLKILHFSYSTLIIIVGLFVGFIVSIINYKKKQNKNL